MWEDEQCKDGGRWSLRVPKTHTNKYWEDITLALIGENFTNEGEVCGIALSLKPVNDIISVWIKSGKDQEKIDSIKADIERVIMLDENTMRLEYENFQEVLSRPPPEKKETFNRNYQKNAGGDQEHTGNEDKGFERRIADNGGGFQRGRGRGRGGRGGLNQ
jgi:translation initiation factor 4E